MTTKKTTKTKAPDAQTKPKTEVLDVPGIVAPGAITIQLIGYRCQCARTGCLRTWTSTCHDCPSDKHLPTCHPPARCPGCKSVGWQRPAAWVPGAGTSRESIRRREVARVAKRARRSK